MIKNKFHTKDRRVRGPRAVAFATIVNPALHTAVIQYNDFTQRYCPVAIRIFQK